MPAPHAPRAGLSEPADELLPGTRPVARTEVLHEPAGAVGPTTPLPRRPDASPTGVHWELSWGDQRATVDERGGGIRTYAVSGVPLLDGYDADEPSPGGAGQILAPWPNRLRDGRYEFEGREYALPMNDPVSRTAIHGLVRGLRWRLLQASASALTVGCELRPTAGYPFSVSLQTRWSLSAEGLVAQHRARCGRGGPAPFGLGVHPYVLLAGATVDGLRLTVPADSVLRTDDRHLPLVVEAVEGTDDDFRQGRTVGAAVLDTAFTGLQRDGVGRATIQLSAPDGASVEVWLDRAFGWVQIFTGDTLGPPRTRRSVAVEPMTCPADAFNSGTDLVVLDATSSWTGSWGIRPAGRG
jgi:aldose 1-epimerase